MSEEGWRARLEFNRPDPLRWPRSLSLTWRILAVNILPLLILGGGIFYLDSYRKVLLDERYKLARIEAQITAEALAGASKERQEAVLLQIGKEQKMRLRMFDAEGRLWADSFALGEPAFQFDSVGDDTFRQRYARWLDRAVDTIVGADPIPDYIEPESQEADAWPELATARAQGLTQIKLRDAPDGTPVINTAAPVGLLGATLLTTRNAVDITMEVREARSTLVSAVLLALLMSTLLSLYMARTIVTPLRMLARATNRVRQGRDRQFEVPRLPGRRDEIHQIRSSTVGADRQSAADDLSKARQIRFDLGPGLRTARTGAKSGNDLVEHQQRAMPITQPAECLEKAISRRHDAHVAGDRFDDQCGDFSTVRLKHALD